jgi:hypothetical protein
MTDTEPPVASTKLPAAGAKSDSESDALVQHHRRNLRLLDLIPYDSEYVAPTEILVLVMISTEYAVNWTQGLEPRGAPGELTMTACVEQAGDPEPISAECLVRARLEVLVENAAGTLVPDGDTFWAHQLLGRLRRAASEELAGLALQRRAT